MYFNVNFNVFFLNKNVRLLVSELYYIYNTLVSIHDDLRHI